MMKSLLLAGAAGLAVATTAQAADMPMDKAEAVEYVKVCSEFGTGFFYIPGTDTCLKVSGYVRARYDIVDRDSEDDAEVDFRARAQVNFDARTATEYGTLRSFIALQGNVLNGEGGSDVDVDRAFIQLGGLTAGYATSAFTYFDDRVSTLEESYYSTGEAVNLLSYTATFGGGFYATLSMEGIEDSGRVNGSDPDESDMPDFVAALGASQGWGDAQIMAALHNGDAGADDEWGYAVGAGVKINLPIAAGGYLLLEGLYADGALGYINPVIDDYYGGESSTGYAINAGLYANITPALAAGLTGAYGHFENDTVVGEVEAWTIGANVNYTVTPGLTVGAYVNYQTIDDTFAAGGPGEDDILSAGLRIQRSF